MRLRRKLIMIASILLVASTVNIAFAAVERVVNGGFETGFTGWTIGHYEPYNFEDPVISTSHHSGSYSAMFKMGAYVEQTFSTPFIASSDLTYWEATSGTGRITVIVTYSDSATSSGIGTKGSGLPWYPVTFVLDHAKQVSKIRFAVFSETFGVHLDDVSLQGSSSGLTVTTPNGGQQWIRGTTYTITWSSTGSPGAYVKIELLKGGAVNSIVTSSTANDGSYSWMIPSTQTLGTDYKIRITSTTNPSITDSSNSNFAITTGGQAALIVTSPNGGEKWDRGTTHTLAWSSSGSPGAYVKIELLKSGVLNKVIVASTANDGSHSWTVPSTQTLGTDYKIRITSTTNPSITDSSNSNFAIVAGTLTVTTPNGGQSWRRGTVHTITWTKSGSTGSYVRIELLKAGVLNKVIISSTPNDGSHSWTIQSTQTIGTNYKIRITSTTYPSITDSSNANFAITA